ncbi:MAG TPA: PQQ-binding-like beta-propeller repeat protein [Thermoanaerobaculia bacterium]|nr:PQQ-binding-like beta-propeller repeat protein [Thermoanaerobaculia bacterium]
MSTLQVDVAEEARPAPVAAGSFPNRGRAVLVLALASALASLASSSADAGGSRDWPQWRGPLGSGVAPHADPPVEWSESKNIAWKVEIPGRGHSTPVVWGSRIFLSTAIAVGEPRAPEPRPGEHHNLRAVRHQRFVVLALDRGDGSIAWRRTVGEGTPIEGGHETGSFASASPVTDGRAVYAFFGSHGLYALDWDGELLWKTDLGDMQTKHGHGEGASPALYGDTLIVNWDHEGPSFLLALDKRSGKEIWRTPRDEPSSWATPIVVEHDGRPQVIVSGTNRLRGYDLATGEVIWEHGGLSSNIVASPVAADGMVFAGSSYDTQAMLAIRLAGARGDITGKEQLVWARNQGAPYVPSPLLYRGSLFYLRHYQGVLTRVVASTGEDRPGAVRLREIRNVYASPVAAAGRIYVTDQEGVTLVLADGDELEMLALNRLDDRFDASAAIAGDDLFLRGERYLYRITDSESKKGTSR